jgi:hypothetical protein
MGDQYRRVCELQVGVPGASGGLLVRDSIANPGLRMQFEVIKTLRSKLNTALIRVYNLSPDNVGKIKGEFQDVLLKAGYEGAVSDLFRGQIRHVSTYRDGNDWITEIDAADGDRDATTATVNITLAAGTTTTQAIQKITAAFKTTTVGHIVVKERTRLRGRVLCGLATDHLDSFAIDNDAHWSFQDGRLDIVRADSTLPTEAIVITAATGMLGAPEVDDKGIAVECLLNPRIRCNGKIQIDNAAVKLKIAKERERQPGAKAPTKPSKAKKKNLAHLDPQGVYKTYKIVHKGDTRDRQWSSKTFAVGLEKTIPAGRAAA